MKGYVGILDALEALGFEVEMDFDGHLKCNFPSDLDHDAASRMMALCENALRDELENRRVAAMTRFFGGPMDGNPHGLYHKRGMMGFRISHGRWAVYDFQKDHRAFFRGYASSEKKAQLGSLIAKESK